jgi:2-keto-4-pentenoate hydratase
LRAADHPPLVLECEFAFTLARDLPSRTTPYQKDEVEDAIATVHPAIEVVAGHLDDWPNQDVWSVIADNGTDGALIHGAGRADWRDYDLADIAVTLTVNGRQQRAGAGRDVMGDPVAALVWLANARSAAGRGLRAGHIHNTGTATAIYWAAAGDHAVADFGPLGAAWLKID